MALILRPYKRIRELERELAYAQKDAEVQAMLADSLRKALRETYLKSLDRAV